MQKNSKKKTTQESEARNTQPVESEKAVAIVEPTALTNEPLAPAFTNEDVQKAMEQFEAFVNANMQKDVDYGVIPNTSNKPSLYKSGGEKLCFYYNLYPQYELVEKIEDWGNQKKLPVPLFHYHYKCKLIHRGSGHQVAEADGECNSLENKYRYRTEYVWSNEAHKKVPTKKDNPNIYEIVNTLVKMAMKRAFVSAVLGATRGSYKFTVDLEDMTNDDTSQQSKSKSDSHANKPPYRQNTQGNNYSNNQNSTTKPQAGVGGMTEPQQKKIFKLCQEKNLDPMKIKEWIKKTYKLNSFSDLSKMNSGKKIASKVIERLTNEPARNSKPVEPEVIDREMENIEDIDLNEIPDNL